MGLIYQLLSYFLNQNLNLTGVRFHIKELQLFSKGLHHVLFDDAADEWLSVHDLAE